MTDFDTFGGGGEPTGAPAPVTPTPVKHPAADRGAAAGLTTADDLSAAVALWVERQPLDRVRCVRVFPGHYRCNWWAPDGGSGGPGFGPATAHAWWGLGTTHTIRKSRLLVASVDAGRLVVTEAAGRK